MFVLSACHFLMAAQRDRLRRSSVKLHEKADGSQRFDAVKDGWLDHAWCAIRRKGAHGTGPPLVCYVVAQTTLCDLYQTPDAGLDAMVPE